MGNIWDSLGALCVIYVAFLWAMFVLDNFIFLILRLLGKEPKQGSQYAFADAFMQRGKDTGVLMAIINIVAHIGAVIWLSNLINTIAK